MQPYNLQIKCLQTGLLPSQNNNLKKLILNANATIFNSIGKYINFINTKKNSYFVSLVLTTSKPMIKYNYKLRGIKASTNVLSLQLYSADDLILQNNVGIIYLGELYICLETALKESQDANISLNEHLIRLYIHGFLHLLGFDHVTEKEATRMYNLENKLLQNVLQTNNIKGLVSNFWQK